MRIGPSRRVNGEPGKRESQFAGLGVICVAVAFALYFMHFLTAPGWEPWLRYAWVACLALAFLFLVFTLVASARERRASHR